jgi:hypothetical protein
MFLERNHFVNQGYQRDPNRSNAIEIALGAYPTETKGILRRKKMTGVNAKTARLLASLGAGDFNQFSRLRDDGFR